MVRGEAERVKVLGGGHNGAELIVVLEGRLGEVGLDDLAGDGDGVILLQVQAPRSSIEDVGRGVEPLGIRLDGLPTDSDGALFGAWGARRRYCNAVKPVSETSMQVFSCSWTDPTSMPSRRKLFGG